MPINNFKKNLICWGAGDQAVVLQPIVEALGAEYNILVDDTSNKNSPFKNVELLAGKKAFEEWFAGRNASEYGFVIAIGNPYGFIRCKLHAYLVAKGITPITICDSSALLDKNVYIGDGVQIMKGVIVNTHAQIGEQNILNTRAIVEHHDKLAEGIEIGPGAILCGRVNIHRFSWICANATILPRITIGENSIVGAGALVRKNIRDNSVVAGVPTKFIKTNSYKG